MFLYKRVETYISNGCHQNRCKAILKAVACWYWKSRAFDRVQVFATCMHGPAAWIHLKSCKIPCNKGFLASLWYSQWMAEPSRSNLVEGCVWRGYAPEVNVRTPAISCLFLRLLFTRKWWGTCWRMLPPWNITEPQILKLLTTEIENTDILTKINPCTLYTNYCRCFITGRRHRNGYTQFHKAQIQLTKVPIHYFWNKKKLPKSIIEEREE